MLLIKNQTGSPFRNWQVGMGVKELCGLPQNSSVVAARHGASKIFFRLVTRDYYGLHQRSTLGPFSGLGACGSVLPSRHPQAQLPRKEKPMKELLQNVWMNDEGEDIAEYAVMLAVILVIVVGMIRLVGGKANNVFSETASAIGG